MFDKIQQAKKLLQLRQEQKRLEQELEKIQHTEESSGIRVIVNGAQKVVSLEFNGEEQKELVDLINRAFKEVQKKAAKKIMDEEGLSSLLSSFGLKR